MNNPVKSAMYGRLPSRLYEAKGLLRIVIHLMIIYYDDFIFLFVCIFFNLSEHIMDASYQMQFSINCLCKTSLFQETEENPFSFYDISCSRTKI